MSFNELTSAEAERLALLLEEAGEVVQAVGKILRHGYDSRHPDGGDNNRELLESECGDFLHAMQRMIYEKDLDKEGIDEAAVVKGIRVSQYLHHQEN